MEYEQSFTGGRDGHHDLAAIAVHHDPAWLCLLVELDRGDGDFYGNSNRVEQVVVYLDTDHDAATGFRVGPEGHEIGAEFALVSSGAIAQGKCIMKITDPAIALSKKQALAAIGQGSLIRAYTDAFRRYGYTAAQILITRDDLDDRHRYLNIRNTFTALFELGAIPIVNENDTVSVDEIQFTDNDMLSAMIIPLVEPHALIILTDTEGVYLATLFQ